MATIANLSTSYHNLVFNLGTGDIDFDEFCTLMARMMGLDDDEPEAEESPKEAFKLLDHKGSGHISATDFREILKSISEKLSNSEINSIIDEIDPDRDDKINFEGWYLSNFIRRWQKCTIFSNLEFKYWARLESYP